ncbi:MAG: HepT-like ribonuclease domain-containing protein, partial [FCB group bacterium]
IREYLDFFNDILKETINIQNFIKGVEFDAFAINDEKIYAVCRSFEIIGEASKKIPPDIQEQFPDIDWKEMAKMRDKLIHYYYSADEQIIWETAIKDIPILEKKIQSLINQYTK